MPLIRYFIYATLAFCTAGSCLACPDQYTVRFAYKPADTKYHVYPSTVEETFRVPFNWQGASGAVSVTLDAKRVDPETLHLALAKQTLDVRSVYLVSLKMSISDPRPYVGHIVDASNGDTWSVQMSPTCKPS